MADDRAALLSEAYKRGLLSADMKAAYEEAQGRGLLAGDVASDIQRYGAMSAGQVAKEAAGSAIPSIAGVAVKTAKGLYSAVTNPSETVNAIADLGTGVIQHFFPQIVNPSDPNYAALAEEAGKTLMDEYGSVAAIKRSIATDPARVLTDLSTVLAPLGGAIRRAPGAIGTLGEVTAETGALADPVTAVGKVAQAGMGLVGQDTAAERTTLAGQGVAMTPGQRAGGFVKSSEDALAGTIPILGDFIKSGQRQSIESFNEAVANQALEPIGRKLDSGTKAGHELVNDVETKLGKAYDMLLPRLTYIPDADFANDMKSILSNKVQTLTKERADQYMNIIRQRLPMTPMSGKDFKKVESELKNIANKYRSSLDGDQRELASALDDTNDAMHAALERSNPGAAAELSKINTGWAMFSRIRAAAGRRTGAASTTGAGVFTPNDLLASIKTADRSVGKGSFARGDALMQQFAEAGQKVLPSTVPDSGTTKRLLTGAALGGASYALTNPLTALGIVGAGVAASAPYTRLGMSALTAATRPGRRRLPVRGIRQTGFQAGRLSDQDAQ